MEYAPEQNLFSAGLADQNREFFRHPSMSVRANRRGSVCLGVGASRCPVRTYRVRAIFVAMQIKTEDVSLDEFTEFFRNLGRVADESERREMMSQATAIHLRGSQHVQAPSPTPHPAVNWDQCVTCARGRN